MSERAVKKPLSSVVNEFEFYFHANLFALAFFCKTLGQSLEERLLRSKMIGERSVQCVTTLRTDVL